MTALNLSSNKLASKVAGKALAEALTGNSILKELNVSSNNWSENRGSDTGDGPGFAQELAVGIKDMGAMTSLNLSSNEIGSEGAMHVAEAIKVRNCVVAVVFEPNSCRSDHWFNCCCLLISVEYGGNIISQSCHKCLGPRWCFNHL
jgi:hypothetical protein